MVPRPSSCADSNTASEKLSYKFQRLREQIRDAIARGEFTGQLPGERELGRRFDANAKTINKALCDLSSEGLLIRHIGRGTFVAGENESRATPSRHQSCLALLPATPATGYRDQLMSALDAALRVKGMRLDAAAVARFVDGRVPLAGWPALRRRVTAALLSYPVDPLSGGWGRLHEDCVSEGLRRQVPMVVLAALSASAKTNAVAPDYGDAGFRLTDHLLQAGCGGVTILISAEGREANMVLAGAQTAGMRGGSAVSIVAVREGEAPSSGLNGTLAASRDRSRPERGGLPAGILCVGSSVLRAVASDERLQTHLRKRSVLAACVSEPGDDSAAAAGLTTYEVDLQKIASWAARLVADSRPGQRPLEVLIPGELKIRSQRETGGVRSAGSVKSEAVI